MTRTRSANRFGRFLPAFAFPLAVLAAEAAHAAPDRCDDLLASPSAASTGRTVTPDDLLRLRDIGMVGVEPPGEPPFALSPDRHSLAVMVRRADPVSNRYCEGLVVAALAPGSEGRLLDKGGDLIRYIYPNLRDAIFPGGIADVNRPAWSPDGRRIAYRKRIDGSTRVWIVNSDGSDAHEAVRLRDDIDRVGWTADGQSLLVSSWPGLREANDKIDEEGKGGYFYDRRVVPVESARPLPQVPIPHTIQVVDLASGRIRAASPQEAERLAPGGNLPVGAVSVDVSPTGDRVWARPHDPKLYLAQNELWFEPHGVPAAPCPFEVCRDKVMGAWWSADGKTIHFLRREGAADESFAFWKWRPGDSPPVKTFVTQDIYGSCQSLGDRLLCDRDASLDPRQLVLLDPETGARQTVFDPNPEWHQLKLGSVQRLHWTNGHGAPCFGDLVLPPDHRPGDRHPLVIVQYQTRGFLRGATGDEYPIQAFAARGFAVLSLQRPRYWTEDRAKPGDPRDWETFQQSNQRDWIDRRNVLDATLSGVDLLDKMGVIDPERVGISGLSEAAMSTWFAVANSHRFKAASMSTCCMDPKTTLVVGGEAWGQSLERSGFPPYWSHNIDYWGPMSLAQNASHVTTPILMQLAADEFILGLESYESLKEQGKPVEMRVFPDEYHWKWQPVHRLAIYERNLDWFDFWLQDRRDASPDKRDQYARWDKMRASLAGPPKKADSGRPEKPSIATIQASTSQSERSRE